MLNAISFLSCFTKHFVFPRIIQGGFVLRINIVPQNVRRLNASRAAPPQWLHELGACRQCLHCDPTIESISRPRDLCRTEGCLLVQRCWSRSYSPLGHSAARYLVPGHSFQQDRDTRNVRDIRASRALHCHGHVCSLTCSKHVSDRKNDIGAVQPGLNTQSSSQPGYCALLTRV